jgi:sarcosine oxidase gamma subunit
MFKSAMYEGRDIADEPFDLGSTDVNGVVVTFTTRGTRLSGAVRSERGRPDPETSVLLYPASPSAWTPTVSSFRMRSVRTSATGTYSMTSIPPGEYYVVAVAEETFPGWQDPKRLAELARRATRVRIADGQTLVQDLRTVRDR